MAVAVWLSLALWGSAAAAAAAAAYASDPSSAGEPISPATLLLIPGQIQTLTVSEVVRVAVGDPEVADVTIVSPTEVLVQAKKAGSTNLIFWDAQGQRVTTVNVVDPRPETVARELTQLLEQMHYPSLTVKRQGNNVFLMGQADDPAQLATLEQTIAPFEGLVVNLVTIPPAAAVSVESAPLVKLSVQVVEMSRTDLEKLGVKWSESVSLTESTLPAASVADSIMRIGQTVQRSSLLATLNALVEQNRARLLSEPKLVTASGKEASSFIGVEVPVIQATSVGTDSSSVSASIEFRETGVLLRMTPTVLEGEDPRRITTVLQAEVSSIDKTVGLSVPVGSQTILVPGFKVRKTNTEVTTLSGETIIIAGLLEAEDTNDLSQVPALGNIPVLGRLFRSPTVKSTQRELVIAVTPELMGDEGDAVDRQLALEQALAVAEVTASVDDPRLRYALQVQDRIAKALRYPQREKELNIEGTVKLKLHLFADGTLGRAMVSSSSGIEALDMEALKAAESQAPYPGFPSQLTERELWLEIPVIFRP